MMPDYYHTGKWYCEHVFSQNQTSLYTVFKILDC